MCLPTALTDRLENRIDSVLPARRGSRVCCRSLRLHPDPLIAPADATARRQHRCTNRRSTSLPAMQASQRRRKCRRISRTPATSPASCCARWYAGASSLIAASERRGNQPRQRIDGRSSSVLMPAAASHTSEIALTACIAVASSPSETQFASSSSDIRGDPSTMTVCLPLGQ